MRDLRRQALESGKTVSKKAQSKRSSRATSQPTSGGNSRPGSRNNSRPPSDDEDGQFSDDTSYSINSIDEFLASDDFNEAAPDVLKIELGERIEELLARKGSTNKGREDCLASFIRLVSSHLVADMLYGRVSDLVTTFSKSIKAETSERETMFALRALALTAITIRDDQLYESVASLLKRTISDSQSLSTKAAAVHCLGNCLAYGGAGEDEIMDQMTFLLEIVSSDGHFIDAGDHVETVVSSLQVYGFLATQVHNLEGESEDVIAAFSEQLDSVEPDVQVAAGENIALLYEKAYRYEDSENSEEDDEDEAEDEASEGDDSGDGEPGTKRYDAYHNSHEITEKVSALASISGKKLNRKSKKNLHQSFTAILATIEDPAAGLRYNNRSHMVIRIHNEGEMLINRWWKLMRLNTLRRLLQGGFINHYYEGNKNVLESLPVLIDRRSSAVTPEKGAIRKYKDQSYSPRSLQIMTEE